ncbi:reducing type I polyketide synthase 10 [Xylariaceae sp. FL1019]|nr:reducing type I polyketide synthase 10 [Xylariaceae sp. FL1019]
MAPHMMSGSDSPGSGESSGASTPFELSPNSGEPIAICGIGCRLPGQVSSPQALWDLLSNAKSANGRVPQSRFNLDGFYHPEGNDHAGSINMEGGYFLDDSVREFENSFFGINNLEATFMDPQQRKLLEVVFECLENAGIPLEQASGSNTGCYVGNFTFDYMVMQMRDPDHLSRYSATGLGTTILSNRISHVFNLLGPSFVLDTACSSSLYCLHAACTALERGECDAAIVAGANLIQSVEQHMATMKAGVLSATSACHTFDSSADGYGRGEGIGALYVKRLADALRDGDSIRSIVRSSAVNANGHTAGISLPSAAGQTAVIKKAMKKGGVHPDDVTFVECHGTGTKVGDAIELDGLASVFKRQPHRPLYIGSVKSNIGHSEAASGIASVIKSTLALEHGRIPPTYGLKNINEKLKLEERSFKIPTETIDWPEKSLRTRLIGINSFGYGGANAHVILEEAPSAREFCKKPTAQNSVILPLSAATEVSLEARRQDFAGFDFGEIEMDDLIHTLALRRTQFAHRGFLLASRDEPIAESFNEQENFLAAHSPVTSASLPPFAFVFTGQGSQWPGMCRELLSEFTVFRESIVEMDTVLEYLPDAPSWRLVDALLDDSPELIHSPERSQPCCTAIQIALVRLLESWGVVAATAVGHSSGEIAAAFAAGHLSAAEAITISYYRGFCAAGNTQAGAMMAVGLSESAASSEISIAQVDGKVCIACINSPDSVTVSGDEEQLDQIMAHLQEKKIFARKLKTGGQAYHSHHMLTLGSQYQKLLDRALPALEPSMKQNLGAQVVSSVTGRAKTAGFDTAYWRSNLEGQVRFASAIDSIHAMGEHFFVELGPHTSMELPIKQTLAKAGATLQYDGPVKRNVNAARQAMTFAGNLWLRGFKIDWVRINGLSAAHKNRQSPHKIVTDLPAYRFHYGETKLWNESRASVEYRQRRYPRHELLGSLVPGGNGRDFIFRNMLRMDVIPWLRDHKLVETVVFPGSGYLCMAIEAALQVTDPARETGRAEKTFEMTNVHITNALPLSPDHPVEIFTSLQKSQLTKATASNTWWDFSITTYNNSQPTTHASGCIAVSTPNSKSTASIRCTRARCEAPKTVALETTHKRVWYERFAKGGLNYGPTFQSIAEYRTPRSKNTPYASARAPLLTASGDLSTTYAAHPITLDALIQLAIVSTAKGVPKNMHALVPTRISSVSVRYSPSDSEKDCQLNAVTERIGFGYYSADAELVDQSGEVTVRLDGFRLSPYESAAQSDESEDVRHPVLRVLWKPDVHGLGELMMPEAAQEYAQKFADEAHSPVADTDLLKMGALLDLFAHKDPTLRILELGNVSHELTLAILELLSSQTDFKRLATYHTAHLAAEDELLGGEVDLQTGERTSSPSAVTGSYDLVLLLTRDETQIRRFSAVLSRFMTETSFVISFCPDSNKSSEALSTEEFQTVPVSFSQGTPSLIYGMKRRKTQRPREEGNYVIIEREADTMLGTTLVTFLEQNTCCTVSRLRLDQVTPERVPKGTTAFSLCELQSPLLAGISDEDMHKVKIIIDNVSSLIWTTNADILHGTRPDHALMGGLSRALMLEQPSLKVFTYDIDEPDKHLEATAQRLAALLSQGRSISSSSKDADYEFVQRKGVVHVSRFVPDDAVNQSFRSRQGLATVKRRVDEAGDFRLLVRQAGQLDTIYFHSQGTTPTGAPTIGPGEVRIKVASVGVNAKDYYVLVGRVDTPDATCQLECAGTVTDVGSAVTEFAVGDRVVAMAPSYFGSYQVLPQWACFKLTPTESFDVAATLPLVYATALYALYHRANIRAGESILIHSGAGGVGIAAIQIAMRAGAEVYTTVSSSEKREFLTEQLGVKSSNIFSSLDTSFQAGILEATSGRGVDIALNSLTGDQLHATWKCCAPFGRFVEIGKADLTAGGRLEMEQFVKDTTFSAFDLSHLYHSDDERLHKVWKELLGQVFSLYRQGHIAAFQPLRVFDIDRIGDAYRHFSSRNRIGKVAISFERPESTIDLQPSKYASQFDSNKSYVMVGCLGGLGRTLSRWMMSRGATKFAFLGRSGTDKMAARRLVEDLEVAGATCEIVRGDVCNLGDVEAVVAAATERLGPIGGVVQAAMGLSEAIFSVMPNSAWHTGIDPKVHGSWNLLHSLQNVKAAGESSSLDFFLMTSSVSGSVGTATEGNYCAGNHFLDLFARHLRTQHGIPAVAVGFGMISEVGYLHDNPEIEALLTRKGIQAIDADELIQLTDLALSSSASLAIPHAHDALAASHLLTGMEPHGIKELRKKGFEGTQPAMEDPRAKLLASALDGVDSQFSRRSGAAGDLPEEVATLVQAGLTPSDAVLSFVRKRFGNLVLMKAEAVDVKKPLAQYGMDSMIGAEFRVWFYKSMRVDVPLVMLLGSSCTVESLRDLAMEVVEQRAKQEQNKE